MMPATTPQDHRFLSVSTVLGKDVLALKEFSGAEKLSAPFAFTLSLVSVRADIQPEALLGTPVSVRLEMPSADSGGLQTRWFHGYIARFQYNGGDRQGLAAYEAEMVPWLWFLTRKSDCRIFRHQSVPEILAVLFEEAGFKDGFEPHLEPGYPPRDFCVQYRETAFHFACRLMEEEGIYYFFRHAEDQHTLVLADSMQVHKPASGFDKLTYRGSPAGGAQDQPSVAAWQATRLLKPDIYSHNDFNFLKPKPMNEKKGQASGRWPAFEHYEFPGGYQYGAEGERYAQLRLEDLHAGSALVEGESEARGLAPGNLFTLTDHPREDQNVEYLLRELHYEARSAQWSSGGADTRPFFTCRFTAMPAKGTFRAPRVTLRPRICGPQTAMVCGPPGEEIWANEHGCVKVQFHWDRDGAANDSSSCWIRVSQMWAGKNWGALFLPRIGQEVIVEFLDGDPDRPVITGSTYNGVSKVPYTLADESGQPKAAIKSLSSPGGEGFNELRMDDARGAEQVFLHAQKDFDIRTLGECREWVGADRHLEIEGSQFEQVARGDKHQKIEHGTRNERIGGSHHLRTGQNAEVAVGDHYGLAAGGQVHVGGSLIVMEAPSSICIRSGASHLTITAAGISLSGTPLLINSGGTSMFDQPGSPARPALPRPAGDAGSGSVETVDAHPLAPLSSGDDDFIPVPPLAIAGAATAKPNPCAGLGMAVDANARELIGDMKKLQQDWPNLTPAQRRDGIQATLNRQAAKSGVPTITANPASLSAGNNGNFDVNKWNINLNQDLLNSNSLSDQQAQSLGNTMFHETRHAEQFFLVARLRAAQGEDVNKISSEIPMLKDAAQSAVANPLSVASKPETACALALNNSLTGTGRQVGAATDNQILASNTARAKAEDRLKQVKANPAATAQDLANAQAAQQLALANFSRDYPAYAALPEEADAFQAGDMIDQLWNAPTAKTP